MAARIGLNLRVMGCNQVKTSPQPQLLQYGNGNAHSLGRIRT